MEIIEADKKAKKAKATKTATAVTTNNKFTVLWGCVN
jgi:hypothetical protein